MPKTIPRPAPAAARKNGQPAGPCTMVIFGASGDLTKRKLVPALYNLCRQGLLSEHFAVIGFARGSLTTESFRRQMREDIGRFCDCTVDAGLWDWIESRIHYVSGDATKPESFQALRTQLAEVERDHGTGSGTGGNVLFYLATAPEHFGTNVRQLRDAELTHEREGWRRVIIEKPFG